MNLVIFSVGNDVQQTVITCFVIAEMVSRDGSSGTVPSDSVFPEKFSTL